MLSRRLFLASAAAAGSAFAAPFRTPLAAQLYTLRRVMPQRPAETLKRVAAIGYRDVQMSRKDLDAWLPLAKDAGLGVLSVHIESWLITGQRDTWQKFAGPQAEGLTLESTIAQLNNAGIRSAVLAYLLPGAERGDLDFYRALAEKMNRAGEQFSKAGIEFGYHNHAFEFGPQEGSTPAAVLLERWDPKYVKIEADVFWLAVAGQDPAAFIRQHKDRVTLLHLKDKAAEQPIAYTEKVAKESFRECGSGVLDFPALLRAARDAKVRGYIVEQDECPGDPLESLEKSYRYLRGLNL
jgi:sugar phosphate isomerase/epimerase